MCDHRPFRRCEPKEESKPKEYIITEKQLDFLERRCDADRCDGGCPDEYCPIEVGRLVRSRLHIPSSEPPHTAEELRQIVAERRKKEREEREAQ
jgi:hypothetical protein